MTLFLLAGVLNCQVLDLTTVDPDLRGFGGGTTVGKWVYLAPFKSTEREGVYSSKVVRIDTDDFTAAGILYIYLYYIIYARSNTASFICKGVCCVKVQRRSLWYACTRMEVVMIHAHVCTAQLLIQLTPQLLRPLLVRLVCVTDRLTANTTTAIIVLHN
jgi:hypothetical protein